MPFFCTTLYTAPVRGGLAAAVSSFSGIAAVVAGSGVAVLEADAGGAGRTGASSTPSIRGRIQLPSSFNATTGNGCQACATCACGSGLASSSPSGVTFRIAGLALTGRGGLPGSTEPLA